MKKTGFTLIELLVVIVILAIVALIATPIVLDVIDSANTKAAVASTAGYAEAIKFARIEYMFKHEGAPEPTWEQIQDEIKVSGTKPSNCSATIVAGDITLAGCEVNGKVCGYSAGSITCTPPQTP